MSRAQELFLQAVALPESERDRWLRDNCGDKELLIRSLLKHDANDLDIVRIGLTRELLDGAGFSVDTDGKLTCLCPQCETPYSLTGHENAVVICDRCGSEITLAPSDGPESSDTEMPSRIGRFEIVQRLGQGAFATVYKALDMKLNRIVALKIPSRIERSSASEKEFLREAQTAARLQHPNIVSVHEVGLEAECSFIVSDLVDGSSLSEWLQHSQLTLCESAELLITIARAVHYAHEQGVIHRDLKPSNILLDAARQPHVTDFGIAKVDLGGATITTEGQILGTPSYMSPEQARGERDIDCRSDVYALGVILFELLTGELPFRGHSRMVMHRVVNDQPVSPRQYDGSIPKDLETICLKCLEKSPTQRYHTARDMGDDLSNWLLHRPITARPVGRIHRSWRWCRRKPVVATLAAMLLLALLSGTLVSTFFAIESYSKANALAHSLESEQRLVADKEMLNAELAESNRSVSVRASEAESVLDFFRERVLAANRPTGVDGGLGISATITDAVIAAEPLIANQFNEQPLVEAAIRQTICETFLSHGRYEAAVEQAQRCWVLRVQHLGDRHMESVRANVLRAEASLAAGDFESAVVAAEEARSTAETTLGRDHSITLDACLVLGSAYESVGEVTRARKLLEKAVRRLESENGRSHPATLTAQSGLAVALRRTGQIREAVDLHELVVNMAAKSFGSDHPTSLQHSHDLAISYATAGRITDAIKTLQETLQHRRNQLGESHPETLATMISLADLQGRSGNQQDAAKTLERAQTLTAESLGIDHPNSLDATSRLANAKAYEDPDVAIQLVETMLPLAKRKLGDDHVDVCRWQFQLAEMLEQTKRSVESVALKTPLLRRIRSDERQAGETEALASASYRLGTNLIHQQRFEEAREACAESVAIFQRLRPKSWKLYYAQALLGECYLGLGHFDNAETHLLEGFHGLEESLLKLPDYTPVDFARILKVIVRLYDDSKRPQESALWSDKLASYRSTNENAIELRKRASEAEDRGNLRDAVELYEKAESLPLQRSIHRPARIYARTHQWEKALGTFRYAFPPGSSWQEAVVLYRLGRFDEFRDKRREVLQNYRSVHSKAQYQSDLQMALLLPLSESMQIPVRFLSAVNENRLGDSRSFDLIGKAKYRLGEFSTWYESLPADSPLRDGRELLIAITNFQRKPNVQTSDALGLEIENQRRSAIDAMYGNLNAHRWAEYIDKMAWLHEAQRVLSGNSANSHPEWPDDDVDLIEVSRQIVNLRKKASDAVELGNLQKAIGFHEKIAHISGQQSNSELVDLYARSLDWENALGACSRSRKPDYRTALILYQLDRIEECRGFVKTLLKSCATTAGPPSHHMARAAILLPVEPEMYSMLDQIAAENSAKQVQQWRSILVGPLMYRRERFVEWHSATPESSPLLGGGGSCNELLHAVTKFQESPSESAGFVLQEQISELEQRMSRLIERGDLGENWVDHIWRSALAAEASQVLKTTATEASTR